MTAHGSRSCYLGGCRHPECVEANSAYMRAYRRGWRRRRGGVANPRPGWDDNTNALCWCGSQIVEVPTSEIRAGRTGSCKRSTCNETVMMSVEATR